MIYNIVFKSIFSGRFYNEDFIANLICPLAMAASAERPSQPMKLRPVSPPIRAP